MKHSVPPVLGHSSTQPVWLAPPAQFPTTAPSPTWSGGAGSPPVSAGPVLVCTMCGENTPEGQQGKGEQGDPPYRGGRYRYRDPHFTGGVTEALLAPGFTVTAIPWYLRRTGSRTHKIKRDTDQDPQETLSSSPFREPIILLTSLQKIRGHRRDPSLTGGLVPGLWGMLQWQT